MKKRVQSLFLILLLLGAGASFSVYFWWPSASVTNTKSKISANSPRAQSLVNKHLWLASQNQEIQEKKMELENSYGRFEVGDSIWPQKDSKAQEMGVDHSADRNENNAFEDLNRYKKEFQISNPDQIIQGELADQKKKQEYTESYRAEYAKQFIENARRKGYLVKLNADYVVISVTPIAKPGERIPSMVVVPSGPQAQ